MAAPSSEGATEAPGSPEYGSTRLPACSKPHRDASERSCGSHLAGRDWPVLALPWLIFAVVLVPFAIGSQWLLCILALLFGLYVSGVLTYLSVVRSGPWAYFSGICCLSVVVGLVLGLVLRTEERLSEEGGRRSLGGAVVLLLVYLLMVLALSRALPLLGCQIIGSSAAFAERNGWGWNPTAAAVMRFGGDFRSLLEMLTESREFPEQVCSDLLRHRCYWSGEPAFDYAFHVANEHSFLSVLFAHPAHPYEKYERLLVLMLFASLIVFPQAAFSVAVHNKVLRAIVILVLVTAPRNLLRMYLKRIVIADDELVLKDAQEQRAQKQQPLPPEVMNQPSAPAKRWQDSAKAVLSERTELRPGGADGKISWREAVVRTRAANAFRWEAVFFAVGFTLAGLIALSSCLYVKAHAKDPLDIVLLESTSGLGWAFVLELVFDQLLNYRPSEDKHRGLEEKWFLGFFHRWRQERDEYLKRPSD
mmetsp:Transcript_124955/g.388986  ORF Transcript_124955/g.388986 Transcript_124955/m.388986 type:complete len:476 (+) Transcript_124955:87-1514(+)